MKNELEVQLAKILSKAPGFSKVDIVRFTNNPDDRPCAFTNLSFNKADMEEKERESSLTLEQAIPRWFELDAVNELYDTSDFGVPVILTGNKIRGFFASRGYERLDLI